jgi:hypothetical protein
MPAAANIDEAIQYAPQNVADISRNPGLTLLNRLDDWTGTMFSPGALVGNDDLRGVRTVRDWYGPTLLARQTVVSEDDPDLLTGSTLIGESQVIDVLVRTLWAVKYATINGDIAAGVEANVVLAYNAAWT